MVHSIPPCVLRSRLFTTPLEADSPGRRIDNLNLDIKLDPSEPWKYDFKNTMISEGDWDDGRDPS